MLSINYNQFSNSILLLFLVSSLTLLFIGGEIICRTAIKVVNKFNISPLVAGLTIVAITTSIPEMSTSFYSAIKGNTDIAIGNILGSNIVNISLILGVSSIINPILLNDKFIFYDIIFSFLTSLIFYIISYYSNSINFYKGLFLLIISIYYLYYNSINKNNLLKENKKEIIVKKTFYSKKNYFYLFKMLLNISFAIFLLSLATSTLINTTLEISYRLNINQLFIGLTIIALGTSLPELSTCIIASLKKEYSICIGNILGSNIFNILLIAGGVSCLKKINITNNFLYFEYPLMLFLHFLLIIVSRKKIIKRSFGLLLIVIYFMFIIVSYCLNKIIC